jgi:hypothetical protein
MAWAVSNTLQDPSVQPPPLQEQDSYGTPGSEQFTGHGHTHLGHSSYNGSSREER